MIAEGSVIGQDQQTGGVLIETADREQEVFEPSEQVVDRRPSFRIFVGRQVAFGLVKEDVLFFAGRDGAAVQSNLVVVRIHPEVGRLNFLSVDGDAAGADPTASLGARAESGPGDDPVEGLLAIVFERGHSL